MELFREQMTELAALLRRDLTRLRQQIEAFPDDGSLWQTAPGISNSAGNLALHLEGNLREYIGRRLGGLAYERNRPGEFGQKGLSRAELAARIESLGAVAAVVETLTEAQWAAASPPDALPGSRSIGQQVMSLYGHFHYHLGQIDYLRRFVTKGAAITAAQLA
jgi:hypothetical protein